CRPRLPAPRQRRPHPSLRADPRNQPVAESGPELDGWRRACRACARTGARGRHGGLGRRCGRKECRALQRQRSDGRGCGGHHGCPSGWPVINHCWHWRRSGLRRARPVAPPRYTPP
ncbi:hypothetical protein TRAPUB_5424, partial [Trametes pubescens]